MSREGEHKTEPEVKKNKSKKGPLLAALLAAGVGGVWGLSELGKRKPVNDRDAGPKKAVATGRVLEDEAQNDDRPRTFVDSGVLVEQALRNARTVEQSKNWEDISQRNAAELLRSGDWIAANVINHAVEEAQMKWYGAITEKMSDREMKVFTDSEEYKRGKNEVAERVCEEYGLSINELKTAMRGQHLAGSFRRVEIASKDNPLYMFPRLLDIFELLVEQIEKGDPLDSLFLRHGRMPEQKLRDEIQGLLDVHMEAQREFYKNPGAQEVVFIPSGSDWDTETKRRRDELKKQIELIKKAYDLK